MLSTAQDPPHIIHMKVLLIRFVFYCAPTCCYITPYPFSFSAVLKVKSSACGILGTG